jgi:hypothetical protein
MKNIMTLPLAVATALIVIVIFGASLASAANTKTVQPAGGVCGIDIAFPQKRN